MLIARKKRKENIAEYILYMWQVEDIIRAYDFDANALKEYIHQGYKLSPEEMAETEQWYEELAMEMQLHDVVDQGHVQRLTKIVEELQVLSDKLLKDPTQSLFASVYYAALPSIVELRKRSQGYDYKEVEAAFVGIYGYLTLKNRGEEVSEATLQAVKQLSTYLALLADRYRSIEEGTFQITEAQSN